MMSMVESKTRLVEQINIFLHSGDYSRALDLLRGTAAEFPDDAELSELEKLAQDGVKRNAEANRLITESQELFAQQKSARSAFSCCAKPTNWINAILSPAPFWPMPWSSTRIRL